MAENGVIHIGCFLEDIAHERFISAVMKKLANSLPAPSPVLQLDIRNATGGRGRAVSSFGEYLERWARGSQPLYSILIVAIDSNCVGYPKRKREIIELKDRKGYPGQVVCAVPNPHIEKWYLADPRGFQECFDSPNQPVVPKRKCERDRYKQALLKALRDASFEAPLGGAEYGDQIVEHMELGRAGQNDRSLGYFIRDLHGALLRLG